MTFSREEEAPFLRQCQKDKGHEGDCGENPDNPWPDNWHERQAVAELEEELAKR